MRRKGQLARASGAGLPRFDKQRRLNMPDTDKMERRVARAVPAALGGGDGARPSGGQLSAGEGGSGSRAAGLVGRRVGRSSRSPSLSCSSASGRSSSAQPSPSLSASSSVGDAPGFLPTSGWTEVSTGTVPPQ